MTGSPVAPRTTVQVLQDLVAAEHAVVYGYGVAGARLNGAARDRAQREWAWHRAARDDLETQVREGGGEPPGPAAAYALPVPAGTPDEARALLALVEERLAAVWADAVADLTGDLRRQAVEGLTSAALAAARWRRTTVPFPGLPER